MAAQGLSYSDEELDQALAAEVHDIVHDSAGKEELAEILGGIDGTDFSDAGIKALLSLNADPEDWRVGEALAQAYLVVHRTCSFPWPGSRDLKNPVSSPAGTDLVGFVQDGAQHKFAFGEVKTSTEEKWPPSLIYGRHGLKQQLEDLRDSVEHKDALVRYLGLHASGRPWEGQFKQAVKTYLASKTNVAIFGVSIRDVSPSADDLSARAKSLANGTPADIKIELLAIYLPLGAIPSLPKRCKKGGISKQ